MIRDPIVEEVRAARQRLFETCGEDLNALLDHFQEQEELDRDRIVSDIPPKVEHAAGPARQGEEGPARQKDG